MEARALNAFSLAGRQKTLALFYHIFCPFENKRPNSSRESKTTFPSFSANPRREIVAASPFQDYHLALMRLNRNTHPFAQRAFVARR